MQRGDSLVSCLFGARDSLMALRRFLIAWKLDEKLQVIYPHRLPMNTQKKCAVNSELRHINKNKKDINIFKETRESPL